MANPHPTDISKTVFTQILIVFYFILFYSRVFAKLEKQKNFWFKVSKGVGNPFFSYNLIF